MARDRMKMFAQEYVVDFNATQAAIRAGYSVKTASNIGSENLGKPEIQALIQDALKERMERLRIDQDRVVLEVAEIAFDRDKDDTTRLKALELLGKMLGMYTAKVEHSGEAAIRVVLDRETMELAG